MNQRETEGPMKEKTKNIPIIGGRDLIDLEREIGSVRESERGDKRQR